MKKALREESLIKNKKTKIKAIYNWGKSPKFIFLNINNDIVEK
jgi:hypothetical protein